MQFKLEVDFSPSAADRNEATIINVPNNHKNSNHNKY